MLALLLALPLLPLEDDHSYVTLDTAWSVPIRYIDNLADTLKINGHQIVGSGPYSVHFKAQFSPSVVAVFPAAYYAWQVSTDQSFEQLTDMFFPISADGTISEMDYEFSDAGTYYVRFRAELPYYRQEGIQVVDTFHYTTPEVWQIQVNESMLEVPNILIPESPSGKNKVFKVKYRSLVSFEMYVYNRWGQQLFHSTDPADGWDGTYGGSTVPTGAYYYVINAVGTEGFKYRKRGAVNVLKTKTFNNE